MAEGSESINSRDRATCMLPFLGVIQWKLTLFKMLEVAQGVAYIHSEGVVHGDIRGVFYCGHDTILRC